MAEHAPLQAVAAVAPSAAVVVPVAQTVQAGFGVMELPPADQVPLEHTAHVAPPWPGRHTAWEVV